MRLRRFLMTEPTVDPSRTLRLRGSAYRPDQPGTNRRWGVSRPGDHPAWKKLPIITLTAKAMPDDQQRCIEAGANDYMAKPLDVEKLLSLVRVWMPK